MSHVLYLRYPSLDLCQPTTLGLAARLFGQRAVRKRLTPTPCQWQSSSPSRKIVFSGIQPTGVPHLGNYLGALKQWVRVQEDAAPTSDVIFSIVDLHAMTLPYNRDQLCQWKRQTLAALLAVGLNPDRSTIFFQSAVGPEVSDLPQVLKRSCNS